MFLLFGHLSTCSLPCNLSGTTSSPLTTASWCFRSGTNLHSISLDPLVPYLYACYTGVLVGTTWQRHQSLLGHYLLALMDCTQLYQVNPFQVFSLCDSIFSFIHLVDLCQARSFVKSKKFILLGITRSRCLFFASSPKTASYTFTGVVSRPGVEAN